MSIPKTGSTKKTTSAPKSPPVKKKTSTSKTSTSKKSSTHTSKPTDSTATKKPTSGGAKDEKKAEARAQSFKESWKEEDKKEAADSKKETGESKEAGESKKETGESKEAAESKKGTGESKEAAESKKETDSKEIQKAEKELAAHKEKFESARQMAQRDADYDKSRNRGGGDLAPREKEYEDLLRKTDRSEADNEKLKSLGDELDGYYRRSGYKFTKLAQGQYDLEQRRDGFKTSDPSATEKTATGESDSARPVTQTKAADSGQSTSREKEPQKTEPPAGATPAGESSPQVTATPVNGRPATQETRDASTSTSSQMAATTTPGNGTSTSGTASTTSHHGTTTTPSEAAQRRPAETPAGRETTTPSSTPLAKEPAPAPVSPEQARFQELSKLTGRDDQTGRDAVKALAESGGAQLQGLVDKLGDLPAGSRQEVFKAITSQLDTPEGRQMAEKALQFGGSDFRRDVYADTVKGLGKHDASVDDRAYYEKMRNQAITDISERRFGLSSSDGGVVSDLLQSDPSRLLDLTGKMDTLGSGAQFGVKSATLKTLKSEAGQQAALELAGRDDKEFRIQLYDQVQKDLHDENSKSLYNELARRDPSRYKSKGPSAPGWADKDGKLQVPENYRKFSELALQDMGDKGKVGFGARALLRTSSDLQVYPGGSAEKFHQALVDHENAGGYMGGDKSWEQYYNLDNIRYSLEARTKIKGPQFERDLRKADLNDKSFGMLETRIAAFPEERANLYSRIKQLEDTAVARGDQRSQDRLKSMQNRIKSDVSSEHNFRETPQTRLEFDRVESALTGMRGGDLKSLEGLSPHEWDYAKARLDGYGQSTEGMLKDLHDKEPQRYRDTLNALNKSEAGNLHQDVQKELQRIAGDPNDPAFDHPELRDTIANHQVVPHASRLAQTWGLEGNKDQIQTQALQAQANYGDEAVRNLKSRTDAWNALPQNLRAELLFDQGDVSKLSKEQKAQLADLNLQDSFRSMAGNELAGQAKSLLTGDPPLEKKIGTMREEKLAELQHELTVNRRIGYINEDTKGLLLGFKGQISAAEDQQQRLRNGKGLTPGEKQRFVDDFTERAQKDPSVKALRDKLQSGEKLTLADEKALTKELQTRIDDYKKTDSFADVVHNDPHWLLDLFDWGSEARYAGQQKDLVGQIELNERNFAAHQREIATRAQDLGALDKAQLSGAYERAKAYGDTKSADQMALESWKVHGADLKTEQPSMARDMEQKGDSLLTESTWDRLARDGKVDGKEAWDKPDAKGFKSALSAFEKAGQGEGKDGVEGARQRALQEMLRSNDFKDITALSGDLAKTYGNLNDFIEGGLTGSPMPAFIDKVRKDAGPLYDKLNKLYANGGVEKARAQIKQMEAMRDRLKQSGDKTGLADLDRNITAMNSMVGLLEAGPDKGIHAMLKTALDPSKMHADTWGNFLKNDGPKIAGAIGGAVAGAVIIGATLGAGTPFVVAAGAVALGGAAGGLIGGELASEANHFVRNQFETGPVSYGDRSRLGSYLSGDKILDPRTMEYRQAGFIEDVGLPYAKQFGKDALIQFATMGLAKGVGAGLGKVLGNPSVSSQIAARGAAIESVYGKEVAKQTMSQWTKQVASQIPKEFAEELGEEGLEHVVQNGLNDIHPGLGMASSLLVATGRSSIDATRVKAGDFNIDYNGADAGHVRAALEASGFNVEVNQQTGVITAKNKGGELVSFKPAGENPSLNWETPQQSLSKAQAKVQLADKMSGELKGLEPNSDAYKAKQAQIDQLRNEAGSLDKRALQPPDAATPTIDRGSRDPNTATERGQLSTAERDLQNLQNEFGKGPYEDGVKQRVEAAERRVEAAQSDLLQQQEASRDQLRLDNADRPPQLSTQEVSQMSREDWHNMIPKAVGGLSPEALAQVPLENLAGMQPKAYNELPQAAKDRINQAALDSNPADFGKLSPDIVSKLPAEVLNKLSPEHLSQLSTESVARMNQASLDDLSPDRLLAIHRTPKTVTGDRQSTVADYRLGEAARTAVSRALNGPDAKNMSADQVRELVTLADKHGKASARHLARDLMTKTGLSQQQLFGTNAADSKVATPVERAAFREQGLKDARGHMAQAKADWDAVKAELGSPTFSLLNKQAGIAKQVKPQEEALASARNSGDPKAIAAAEAKLERTRRVLSETEQELNKLGPAELERVKSEWSQKSVLSRELEDSYNQASSAVTNIESGRIAPTPPGRTEEARSVKEILGANYKPSKEGWTEGKFHNREANHDYHFEKHVEGKQDNEMKLAEFRDPANPLPANLTFKTADGRRVAYSDIKTKEEYTAAARNFVENPSQFPGTEMVVNGSGDVHYYNPNFDLEAMTDSSGNLRTFFRSKTIDHQQGYEHWVERAHPGTAPDLNPDSRTQERATPDSSTLTIKSSQADQLARQYLTDQKLDPRMLDDVQVHRGVDADGRQIASPYVTRDQNGQISMYMPEDQNGMLRAHDFGHELDHVIALKQGGALEGNLREANDAALRLRDARKEGRKPEEIAHLQKQYQDALAEHTAEARGHRFVGWRVDQLAAGEKPSGLPQSPKFAAISGQQEASAQRHDQRVAELESRARFERDPHGQPPLQSLQQGRPLNPSNEGSPDTSRADGVEELMLDSFSPAEFSALNPGEYHDAQHALNVANTVNGLAQNMGRSPERARFLSQVALLHDADERINPATGQQGVSASPASVQRTLQWMEGNQSALQERMGWSKDQFAEAKALIARTDFPFNDAAKPKQAGTRFDNQSPVETYQQLLSDLSPAQQKSVLEDGQLLRFADQTANYTGSRAEAERYVKGLQTELNNDGVPVTFEQLRAGTPGFMNAAGNDSNQDSAIAQKLGIKDAEVYDRQRLMDSMPDRLRQNFEANQDSFSKNLDTNQSPLRLDNDRRQAPPRTLSLPDGSTFQIPSNGTAVTLGREPDANGVLVGQRDPKVSRQHAEMRMQGGKLQVLDRSTNGTYLDGQRLAKDKWTDVSAGMGLRLGDQSIHIPFVDSAQLNTGKPTRVENPDGTVSSARLRDNGTIEVSTLQNTVKDGAELKKYKALDAPTGIRAWFQTTPALEVGKEYAGPSGRQKYLGADADGNHQFGTVTGFDSLANYEEHLQQQSNNLRMDRPVQVGNRPPGFQRDTGRGDGTPPIKPGDPYRLVGLNGSSIEIPTDGTVGRIGRVGLDASLGVSQNHAEIKLENGQFMLRDVGSTNGTFVNGKRLPAGEWSALPPGSSFRLGTDVVRPSAVSDVSAPHVDKTPGRTQGVSKAEAQQVLDQVKIPESAYRPKGQEALTVQDIKALGLEPQQKLNVGGKEIFLSKPFDHDGARTAFLAYVKDPETGAVNQRVFYQSNSQGLWRSASHGGPDGWIGKGSKEHAAEASTNLPVEMQKELHRLSAAGQARAELPQGWADRAFYGGLPMGGGAPPASFSRQMEGVTRLGEFTRPGDPSSFRFHHPEQAPSFQNGPSDSYTFQHPSRGEIQAQVFPSQDGNLSYVFFRDGAGRSWLSQVDNAGAALNDYGVRTNAVDTGGNAGKREGLDVPVVEYRSQIPQGFAGESIPGGPYAEATDYTHQIPVVADYLRWLREH